ncbi:MAG: sugar kinase [Planctomycetota bacterium]|jgi:xylulokinase|nr:sugar kinase [Planctomycetota bacterium]
MYLGVDIGTSGVKASLVDLDGGIVASARRKFRILGLEDDYRELDPLEIAAGAKDAVREAAGAAGARGIDLILVSALGEAIVPADAAGRPLANCIIGSDRRGAEELDEIRSLIPDAALTAITGLNLSVIYSLNKILHIRKHRPEVYARVRKFFLVADYFVHLLTGEALIDYSMASRTLAFDIGRKDWSPTILSRVGVDPGLFSRPALAGTVAGTVRPAVAAELGLPAGVRVAIGAHDHICNALGAAAVRSGHCSNAVGTTEGITAILAGPLQPELVAKHNISCEPFVVDDMYNTVAWHNTAGALINWLLDICLGPDRTAEASRTLLAALDRDSRHEPGRLLALPHFSGATAGRMDDKAKGAILGLTLGTSRGDLYRGLIEGACYECRLILDALRHSGIPVEQVHVSGGGSRSSFWVQAKADILGMPVTVARVADSGALGAAVLASVVCGRHRDLEAAAAAIIGPGAVVEPIAANVRAYGERYREYLELYGKTRAASHLLQSGYPLDATSRRP